MVLNRIYSSVLGWRKSLRLWISFVTQKFLHLYIVRRENIKDTSQKKSEGIILSRRPNKFIIYKTYYSLRSKIQVILVFSL
jgi:hypothetical protein